MKGRKSFRDFLKIYVSCFAIANIPQFIVTYTIPRDQLKPTLLEHLNSETSGLEDISGGSVYANFRLLGSSIGYVAKRLTGCIEDIF
ncbi:hypothetical protein HY212_03680 [Candidatus Pacearchaeota archaeon]|nr:hypothetical protein [Candidatus Pacearchaeota archaeon]